MSVAALKATVWPWLHAWLMVGTGVPSSGCARPLIHDVAIAVGCAKNSSTHSLDQIHCVLDAWDVDPELGNLEGRDKAEVYGEIEPDGVFRLFDIAKDFGAELGADDVFVDLGSGRGRVVLQTLLCSAVGALVGVELVEERHAAAVALRDKLQIAVENEDNTRFQFVHGNFLETEAWIGASFVFTNSLMFSDDLMQQLRMRMLNVLAPGAIVISIQRFRGCRNDVFRYVGHVVLKVTWSREPIKAYIYLRVPNFHLNQAFVSVSGDRETCVNEAWKSYELSKSLAQRLCNMAHGRAPSWVEQTSQWTLNVLLDATCAWTELTHLSKLAQLDKSYLEDIPEFINKTHRLWIAAQDDQGMTVLHQAVSTPTADDVVRMLLSARAEVSVNASRGRTPLHVAQTRRAVELLLDAAADPQATDMWGHSPLHTTLSFTSGVIEPVEVTKLLMNSRAEVNAVNEWGATPLHYAAKRYDEEAPSLVRLLLEIGAETSAKDVKGRTAVDQAEHVDVQNIFRVLQNPGTEL